MNDKTTPTVLFPGDKGWWAAWSRNPFNWLLVSLFVLAYFLDGAK